VQIYCEGRTQSFGTFKKFAVLETEFRTRIVYHVLSKLIIKLTNIIRRLQLPLGLSQVYLLTSIAQ